MDTPLKQNKATSNLLKIQRKYNEDGTPEMVQNTLDKYLV
jgi:hypothetical protein